MNSLLYLLIILSPFLVCAQHTEQVVPLYSYFFSYEIQEGLRSGDMNVGKGAQNFSYIGEYQKALSVPKGIKLRWGLDSFSQEDP
ncbi:hypothetical protein KUV50_16500 [Membranicola marinus]|uniref:Uncharacterized protein n=1 Tax=Membranihabitans marinus TaxID=1227546 RepID=A0A953LCQ6_9BACT|nr:hypothetical protein [Membranihabitans marinus]MBY5959756.1 hypothetical protein [Membranihabitans marinus]